MGHLLLTRRNYGETVVVVEHEDLAVVQSPTERHYPCVGIKVIGAETPKSMRVAGVNYARKTDVNLRGRGMVVIERLVDDKWEKETPAGIGQFRIEFD